MINPATGWFEIKQYDDKKSITVANIVKQACLSRYPPRPYLIIIDRGREFISQDFCDMVKNNYGIKRKVLLTKNSQANAIVKCAHQMLRNPIRSFELQEHPYYDQDDTWTGILSVAAFTMHPTYHTTL
jgi:hypothetical protein